MIVLTFYELREDHDHQSVQLLVPDDWGLQNET